MMTILEAHERARRIWPTLTPSVLHKMPALSTDKTDPGAGHWRVETSDGADHELDGNGHTVCHPACSTLEAERT